MTICHLGHQIRRRRRDHHQIGVARQLDMTHLRLARQVEQVAVNRLRRQRRRRQRRHELLGRAGQHRHHLGAQPSQLADQHQRFIGRDPAANDQKNPAALHSRPHHAAPRRYATVPATARKRCPVPVNRPLTNAALACGETG